MVPNPWTTRFVDAVTAERSARNAANPNATVEVYDGPLAACSNASPPTPSYSSSVTAAEPRSQAG
ncbi:hypothetical protein EV378_5814 [Pseudonocardia endophytica]|uniref:Uncharacterized protein n=1 Tax=Pseudonocardia endophytica TaxID=401976 RepID=A0A4R1HWB1_PSEEN|nr:hypothetical protein [Pseudonocardia endophytica]TCK21822.1 hypothetical protein EV378_5814 [Pseudonocardia endophytica]